MKCPCCEKEADFRISCDGNNSYWFCPDCFISSSSKPWENLTKTKQALNVARNGLEYIFGYEDVPKYVVKHITQVLDQIKQIIEK